MHEGEAGGSHVLHSSHGAVIDRRSSRGKAGISSNKVIKKKHQDYHYRRSGGLKTTTASSRNSQTQEMFKNGHQKHHGYRESRKKRFLGRKPRLTLESANLSQEQRNLVEGPEPQIKSTSNKRSKNFVFENSRPNKKAITAFNSTSKRKNWPSTTPSHQPHQPNLTPVRQDPKKSNQLEKSPQKRKSRKRMIHRGINRDYLKKKILSRRRMRQIDKRHPQDPRNQTNPVEAQNIAINRTNERNQITLNFINQSIQTLIKSNRDEEPPKKLRRVDSKDLHQYHEYLRRRHQQKLMKKIRENHPKISKVEEGKRADGKASMPGKGVGGRQEELKKKVYEKMLKIRGMPDGVVGGGRGAAGEGAGDGVGSAFVSKNNFFVIQKAQAGEPPLRRIKDTQKDSLGKGSGLGSSKHERKQSRASKTKVQESRVSASQKNRKGRISKIGNWTKEEASKQKNRGRGHAEVHSGAQKSAKKSKIEVQHKKSKKGKDKADKAAKEVVESKPNQMTAEFFRNIEVKWTGENWPNFADHLHFGHCLGEGSFAKVYQGIDKITKQNVAIKVIDKRKITSSKRKVLVKNEIFVLSRLNHRSLCKFYRLVEDKKRVRSANQGLLLPQNRYFHDSKNLQFFPHFQFFTTFPSIFPSFSHLFPLPPLILEF